MAMMGLSVNAQSWVAPTIQGEDPVADGTYKVYNVGAAKFLAMGKAWFSWSTTAILNNTGEDFKMVPDGLNWKFFRTETQGVFTSGNGIAGDAMHVDNTPNTYGITKMISGYYHIHDVGGDENSTCWGYGLPSGKDVAGVVAHADAADIAWNCDWIFVGESANALYQARLNLYNLLNQAASEGVNTDAASDVYENSSATLSEIQTATSNLNLARVNKVIDGKTGVDLTSFITNAGFEEGSLIGWTSQDGGYLAGNKNFGRMKGNDYVERWKNGVALGDGSMVHDAVIMPAGIYRVTADAQNIEQYNANAGGTGLFLYANTDKTGIGVAANYSVYTSLETPGDLTIKFVLDNCSGNWISYDNITLTYYAQASDIYDNAVADAEKVLSDAKYNNITGNERTNLVAIKETPAAGETLDDNLDVANNIYAAIDAFTAAASSYDAFVAEKAHAVTLGVSEFPTPTTAAEALAAVNTLKVAEHNAVISKYTTDGSALFIPSWDKDNFDALSNEHWSGTTSEYFDKWSGSAFTSKIYKEVTLPEGHYVFYAAARGQANASTATLKVTIGSETLSVPCTIKGNRGYGINTSGAADFSSSSTYACSNEGFGWEWRHIAFDLDAETTVTLAIECTGKNSWVSAGDTRLVTYDNIAVSMNRYQAALDAAIAARDNAEYANITGSERTALENAINATTPTTREGYDVAADALEAALPVFTAAKASYDAYTAYKAETVAAFGSDLDVAAPTTAAEAVTAVQALNIAQYNKVATEYTFSCSGLIGDFGSWTGTATVAGNPAEPNYLDYEHWSGITHAYYEQASAGWGNAAGWTIQYQKTCTLPAGDYVIKVAARSSAGTTSLVSCSATPNTVTLPNVGASAKGINKAGEASWTDGEFVNGGAGFGWQWRFLPFTLADETEVTMTFYAEATSQYQWMSIADGELLSKTKLAEDVEYSETATNTITDKLIADVTITRNIKAGYNTVVLPFNATANQVKDAFGEGTEVYAYSEDSDNPMAATITFTKGDGSISANVPVLIKATEASAKQVFEGVNIVAPTTGVKVAGTNFDFVGTYAPDNVAKGDWFISADQIWKSDGKTNINAFRAYIHDKTAGAGARIIKFVIDGEEVTAIESLEVAGKNNGKLYNLAGQEVKNAQKGLYIQNGKKVIVK